MTPELQAQVETLVRATLEAEKEFFTLLKAQVSTGALDIELILGNHDRVLNEVPGARAAIRKAFGIKGGTDAFPMERRFEEEGVLAYHGHVADAVSSHEEGVPFAELFCPELITRFPLEIRKQLDLQHPHLDNPHVVEWFKSNHKRFRFDFAQKMKVLLAMSARRGLKEQSRFTAAHDVLFRLLDTKFSATAAKKLGEKGHERLRSVVNGHTHFANMTPLSTLNGGRACYFNVGTWRTVHQLGHEGTPSFMPFDAMGYLAFFGKSDPLGRELEWRQGAVLPR